MAKIDTAALHRLMQRLAAFEKSTLAPVLKAAAVSAVQAEIDAIAGQASLDLQPSPSTPPADTPEKKR